MRSFQRWKGRFLLPIFGGVSYISVVDKTTLRRQFLDQRLNIPRSKYWILTDQIMEQIALLNWTDVLTVHVFLPIRINNEIDTFSILNYLKAEQPHVKIVVPRTNFKDLSIQNILYDHEFTILGRNRYDIPEPIHGKVIDPLEIDVAFVPMLACDLKGNRVG
ncbi:MAG: 5-formyltetrahydrofolate cyclo-ligase, partial [Bacteroidota bacterium]